VKFKKGEGFVVLYLLEKGREIYHLGRLIMEVPGSKRVGIEEFLDEIFKLKRIYSYILPWKLGNLPLIKR